MKRFRQAINNKEFLITAEIMPPKGGNTQHMIDMAKLLQNRTHAINITDGSRAVLRMSSLAASAILRQNGIEPIYQLACRDRNRIALQADLMGAHGLGIRNVLALTGDPVKSGDHQNARSVFDYESVRLLRVIGQLNQGFDSNNQPLTDEPLDLLAGAAIDPQLKSWSALQVRFEKKIAAGAQFFQSQMITDFDRLNKFMTEIANQTDRPILAGIFLIKSAKNAVFINRYVPGINIPEEIIERLKNANYPLKEGMKIAAEQIQMAQKMCQGVHIMAVKKEELIPEILDMAGIAPII